MHVTVEEQRSQAASARAAAVFDSSYDYLCRLPSTRLGNAGFEKEARHGMDSSDVEELLHWIGMFI